MSNDERPICLMDLQLSCDALGMLLFCASEWSPEEEWAPLANSIRPHLKAAADLMAQHVERNQELVKLCWQSGTSEIVRIEMEDLQHHLSGRVAIGPGSPLNLTHTSTWSRADEEDPYGTADGGEG